MTKLEIFVTMATGIPSQHSLTCLTGTLKTPYHGMFLHTIIWYSQFRVEICKFWLHDKGVGLN